MGCVKSKNNSRPNAYNPARGSNGEINIQIISDLVWPLCYVSKRKLETAMRQLEGKYTFKVRWEPFLIRPNTPPEGTVINTDEIRKDPKIAEIISEGEKEGIDFRGRPPVCPCTVLAHSLLEYAAGKDDGRRQNDVAELLFRAYFTDGLPLDWRTLMNVAQQVGYDVKEVTKHLKDEENSEYVKIRAKHWFDLGVCGVPYFVINGLASTLELKDVDTYVQMIEEAATNSNLKA